MIKKTGLLLPRSVLFPSINFDLLEGARSALEAAGHEDVQFATDNIGTGANDQQIYNACERMLMDGVSIIAGYVNQSSAVKLQPLFGSANAIFICIDAGYHFMLPEPQVLPNVVFVSLQGALCCRATATLAMRQGFKSFAFTSSFLDAGYRPAYTYARAIEGGGGQVVFNHVASLKRRDFTIAPLTTFLANDPQHAVVAAYCGDMLSDFCTHAGESGVMAGNLFVSPFMLEEAWLERSDYPGTDLCGVATWAKSLDNATNLAFRKSMEEKGRAQNIFSMLGYEAGQVTAQVSRSGKQGATAVDALKSWCFESPRGQVCIDAATNETLPPLYDMKGVRNAADGKCRLQVLGAVDDVAEQWARLREDIGALTGTTTNWLNTYPCIES